MSMSRADILHYCIGDHPYMTGAPEDLTSLIGELYELADANCPPETEPSTEGDESQ